MSVCRTNHLGFGPEFLGRVRLVTSVASLVGVGLYNSYLKDVPLRKIFLWSTLLGVALGSTQVRVFSHCKFFGTLFLEPRVCTIGNV